jgi:hypothetical protein
MTTEANPLKFQQNRFKEQYDAAGKAAEKLRGEAKRRKITAYVLKGIAVFGGIAVAAGLGGKGSQTVGILISVAVASDGLFSNHKRLLIVTKASNAYSRLLGRITHRFNRALEPILEDQKVPAQKAQAEGDLGRMISSASEMLFEEKQKIDTAVQEEDLKLLNSLSVEGTKSPKAD